MDQLLQRLLDSEILTEDTKKELQAALKAKITEAQAEAREAVEKEVRASLAEQWVSERDNIIRSIDAKVDDYLAAEVAELKEDIERFRDLEAEAATKLTEAKEEMAVQLKGDLSELTKKVSSFLEIRLNAEMSELREDIEEMKKLQFGKKLYEAFSSEFNKNFNDTDGTMTALRDTEARLNEALKSLADRDRKLNESERSTKLREVLAPLSGRHREVMQAILKNIPTAQLQEGYNTFIGRVLKESTEPVVKTGSEKEVKVLAEQKTDAPAVVIKTGDTPAAPSTAKKALTESQIRLRTLGGV